VNSQTPLAAYIPFIIVVRSRIKMDLTTLAVNIARTYEDPQLCVSQSVDRESNACARDPQNSLYRVEGCPAEAHKRQRLPPGEETYFTT
jgi:hypothetical protein